MNFSLDNAFILQMESRLAFLHKVDTGVRRLYLLYMNRLLYFELNIVCVLEMVYGSQTTLAYSSRGRTNVLYAVNFTA